jgi:hypothetical protein
MTDYTPQELLDFIASNVAFLSRAVYKQDTAQAVGVAEAISALALELSEKMATSVTGAN